MFIIKVNGIEFVSEVMLLVFLAVLLCCGGWAPWSDWNPCSVSCGGGFTARMRMCISSPGSECATT